MSPLLLLAATTQPVHAAELPGNPKPSVQLQSWVTAFDQDEDRLADPAGYGDPEADIGVSVPRARIGLEGETDSYEYSIIVGTTAPYDSLTPTETDVGIVGAALAGKLEAGPGELKIGVGTQRVPFGHERLVSSRHLMFQERAVGVQWTAPGYQAGIIADYELDMGVRIRAGAFNGNAGIFGDDNDGFLFAARAEYANNDRYGRMPEKGTIGVAASMYQDTGVATNTLAFGGDLVMRVGPLLVSSEVTSATLAPSRSDIDLPQVTEKTSRLGVTGELGVISEMERGGVQAGARFSLFDDNTALQDNGDVGILHAGVTRWDLVPGFDVGAMFIHREELRGRGLPNDTARLWVQVRWPIESNDGADRTDEATE